MNKIDYDYFELYNKVIDNLKQIFDGNNAEADEIIPEKYRALALLIFPKISWHIKGHRDFMGLTTRLAVTPIGSIEDMRQYTKKLAANVDTPENRTILRNKLAKHKDNISIADSNIDVVDYGYFSGSDPCSQCKGKGQKRCYRCFGSKKETCKKCSGTGIERIDEPIIKRKDGISEKIIVNCTKCKTKGKTDCSSCSGKGRVDCDNCNASGTFTRTCHLVAYATADIFYEIESLLNLTDDASEYLKETYKTAFKFLQTYMSTISATGLNQLLDFNLQKIEPKENAQVYHYWGRAPAVLVPFSLKNKKYICGAFSTKADFFQPAPVFDDLFSNELMDLKIINENKKIKKSKARSFFRKYKKVPVLDKALELVASKNAQDKETNISQVIIAFSGFISYKAAKEFAEAVPKFLKKLSPTSTPTIWVISLIFLSLMSVLIFEQTFEQSFSSFGIFSSILLFITTVIFIYLASFAVNIVSYIVTFIRRLFVEKKYRMSINHTKIRKLFRRILFASIVLGSAYGFFAQKNLVPKLEEIRIFSPEQGAKNKKFICTGLAKINKKPKFCLPSKKKTKK